MKRKIVQIADAEPSSYTVLCDDGSWWRVLHAGDGYKWKRMPDPPAAEQEGA